MFVCTISFYDFVLLHHNDGFEINQSRCDQIVDLRLQFKRFPKKKKCLPFINYCITAFAKQCNIFRGSTVFLLCKKVIKVIKN